MSHSSPEVLIVLSLVVLIVMSFWKQLLLLILSLFVGVCVLGVYQFVLLLHR